MHCQPDSFRGIRVTGLHSIALASGGSQALGSEEAALGLKQGLNCLILIEPDITVGNLQGLDFNIAQYICQEDLGNIESKSRKSSYCYIQ